MSKKLIIIIVNFVVVLIVTFLLINQIKVYQGLHPVYVAKTMIKKGEQITPDMLKQTQVTLNRNDINSKRVSYYNDIITPDNVSEAIGKYAAFDIIQDEIIVQAKLMDEVDANYNYMYNMPKGYYAYVIQNTIPGGIIQANDYIDLYIFDEEQQIMVEEPALRHLRVYDLRDKNGVPINSNIEETEMEPRAAKYIVLALNNHQIRKLMYYQNKEATIRAAIRNRSVEKFDYLETEYPYYAITEDVDIVTEEREKQILEQINKLKEQVETENENVEQAEGQIQEQPMEPQEPQASSPIDQPVDEPQIPNVEAE